MVSYADRLRHAMELAGIPDKVNREARAKLAAGSGVSVQAVGQVLGSETRAFSAETSARAARFLKVDHFWLATGEGEPRPPGPSEEAKAFAVMFDRLGPTERKRWELLVQVARNGVPDDQVEHKMPVTAKKKRHPEDQKR